MKNCYRIVHYLRQQKFDIVALQEVMHGLERTVYRKFKDARNITIGLEKSLHHTAYGPLWGARKIRAYGLTVRRFGGMAQQGNMILSRYPILVHKNQFFLYEYQETVAADRTNFANTDHPRAMQNVIVDIDGTRVRIINVHGMCNKDKLGSEKSLEQCKFILREAKKTDMPTIIVGDFNLAPESDGIKLISGHYTNLCTKFGIKTTLPKGYGVIDYVFVSSHIRVNNFSVQQNKISDHFPLILDFAIC